MDYFSPFVDVVLGRVSVSHGLSKPGDHNECAPFLSRAMKEKIVGTKTVVLPNAGHMTFADQTAIFVNAVDGFVNDKTN